MNEFQIIQKYFATQKLTQANKIAKIGDDAAVFNISNNMDIVQSLDTLVEGVHFPINSSAEALGYRALAVCISDIAAMGAIPHSFLMGLTLPKISEAWLEQFSEGLAKCAQKHNIALIGGDTTKGPLCISIQCQGLVPKGKSLLRSGAHPRDIICITGELGDAAASLNYLTANKPNNHQNSITQLLKKFWYPESQVTVSQELRAINATSAIDVSDGLLQDLNHIVSTSNVGAEINLASIPISNALMSLVTKEEALKYALYGGDDYTLIVTIPKKNQQQLNLLQQRFPQIKQIGVITNNPNQITDENKNPLYITGYQHKWNNN
jgi:thiamine-monophosphate kinase